MSIVNQSKKYWIGYVKKYGLEKFLDKTYEEFNELEDIINRQDDRENKHIDKIKSLEKN